MFNEDADISAIAKVLHKIIDGAAQPQEGEESIGRNVQRYH
jgi:hypothetical protein